MPVLANGNIRALADVARCMEYTGAVGVLSAESLLEDPALFSPRRLLPGGAFGGAQGAQLLLEYLDLVEEYPAPMRMVTGHAFRMLGAWPRLQSSNQLFLTRQESSEVVSPHEVICCWVLAVIRKPHLKRAWTCMAGEGWSDMQQLIGSNVCSGSWLSEFTDLRDRLNQQHKSFGVADIREIAEEVVSRIGVLGRDYPVPKLSERALARMEREAAMTAAIAEQNREEACLKRIAENKAESLGTVESCQVLQAAA